MNDVEGKVAFITGGSGGIGLGIARAFANAGMKVAIAYRTKKHLEEAMQCLESAGERVHPIDVDVTDRAGMQKAAEEVVAVFGKVHVLVNNAGVVHPATFSETTCRGGQSSGQPNSPLK
jgi:NAD(P)-dependent dehydrogenase (short-subunit alcohol dehydrogenase family)